MATPNAVLRRVAVAGVLAVVPLAFPAAAVAEGKCLAWFGARDEGICMGYSNGNPTYIGTPSVGVYGPGGGLGVTTGPLLPGQTINQGINP